MHTTAKKSDEQSLEGLIDLHIHTAPDVVPRALDDLAAARAAAQAGMRAIVLKSHHSTTVGRAAVVDQIVEGVRVFGGVALNHAVGGLNPAAVETALKMGARMIWMPTLDAAGDQPNFMRPTAGREGLSILDARGRLIPAVFEILQLVRQSQAILASGHLPAAETVLLMRQARHLGLQRLLVTHPEAPFIRMTLDAQEELAAMGVFFERCFISTTPLMGGGPDTLTEIGAAIRRVGLESAVLASDLGQVGNPLPVDGLRAFLSGLRSQGFSQTEIRCMAGENPARLLRI